MARVVFSDFQGKTTPRFLRSILPAQENFHFFSCAVTPAFLRKKGFFLLWALDNAEVFDYNRCNVSKKHFNFIKMSKRITIRDVAQSAGMSLATVSGVLNGETRFSEKTTKHVWEVANRLNYMPSASARGLRSGVSGERVKTGIIMHIVHMSNVVPYHDRAQETDVYRLSWQARRHSLFVIPYCYYREAGFQCPPLLNDLIDGAVIGTPHLEIVNTVKAKVPVVLMDVPFSMDFVDVPIVNIDHRYGFLCAMNELKKRGHRRVALVSSSFMPEENFTSGETQMKKMIEDAACSAGLEIVPECSLCDSITAENHDAKMREYAQQIAPAIRAGRMTAIVAPHIYYHLSLKKEFAFQSEPNARNAAYASQHWKLSINSHQNTPPAFTLQKVSRGMNCQLHTGETIR